MLSKALLNHREDVAEDVRHEELDLRLCRGELRGPMEHTREALSSPVAPGDQDRPALPSEQPRHTLLSVWLPSSLRAGAERHWRKRVAASSGLAGDPLRQDSLIRAVRSESQRGVPGL